MSDSVLHFEEKCFPSNCKKDCKQIFGGLVWILVACTLVVPANPQAWVMFVSVFCFVMTFIWMVVFACDGHHNSSSWAAADFAYHGIAAFFYLSAAVSLAKVTLDLNNGTSSKNYQLDIAAVVSLTASLFPLRKVV
uniref:Mal, T cell differentiation protein n=1 Tax=Sander lucioperca TaxID=283035 RepID=A0A8C9Z2V2_SANLU